MVGESSSTELRLVVAQVLAPNSTAVLQTLVRGSRALSEHLLFLSSDASEELSELLAAFAIRIECELHTGRAPSEDWVARFDSLYDRIYAYVDTCERRNKLATVLSAWSDAKQVAAFQSEIDSLRDSVSVAFG